MQTNSDLQDQSDLFDAYSAVDDSTFNDKYQHLAFTSNKNDTVIYSTEIEVSENVKLVCQKLQEQVKLGGFKAATSTIDSYVRTNVEKTSLFSGFTSSNTNPDFQSVINRHCDKSTHILLSCWIVKISRYAGEYISIYLMKHKTRKNKHKLLMVALSINIDGSFLNRYYLRVLETAFNGFL